MSTNFTGLRAGVGRRSQQIHRSYPVVTMFRTLGHALHTFGFFMWEWLFVLWNRPAFLPVLWRLWEWSFFHSPYRLTYRSPEAKHHNLTYGEMSLPTVERILDQLALQPHDKVLDLGSGRGRVVLLAAARGIPAEGVELVEGLIQTARYAAGPYLPLATFTQADFLTIDFQGATVVWAAGTCWEQATRDAIVEKLLQLPEETWVVSVTRPMTHPNLPIRHTVRGWTSWGRDQYFLQQVDNLSSQDPFSGKDVILSEPSALDKTQH